MPRGSSSAKSKISLDSGSTEIPDFIKEAQRKAAEESKKAEESRKEAERQASQAQVLTQEEKFVKEYKDLGNKDPDLVVKALELRNVRKALEKQKGKNPADFKQAEKNEDSAKEKAGLGGILNSKWHSLIKAYDESQNKN